MGRIHHTIGTLFAAAILIQLLKGSGNFIDFAKDTGIKCQSRVNIGNHDKLKCAVMCTQYRAMTGLPCKAFNVTDSGCTLCLNGPISKTKQVIWSSTKNVYAVTVKDYEAELQKGLIIHAPFDAKVGSTSPAIGTTVTLMGTPGPSISSGKFGSALYVPNTGTSDDNKITLGRHENDCLGNVTLCPDGVTISFWFYMFTQPHNWPGPITGPVFYFFAYTPSTNNNYLTIRLYNGTHEWKKSQGIIYNYWHHLAIVYTAKDGFTWYSDGYRRDPITPKPKNKGPRSLDMGCLGTLHCTKAKYDDLRVWNEVKDENFIWRLWQS